jgi:hypothetical protein
MGGLDIMRSLLKHIAIHTCSSSSLALSRGLSSPLFSIRQFYPPHILFFSTSYWKFMIWIFSLVFCVLKEFLMGSCRCINYCLDNTANMMRKVHATINYAWSLLLTLCMLYELMINW